MSLRVRYVLVHLGLFLALGMFLERSAMAYTDPGSALLIFQSASAFITGTMFYFRKRLKRLLMRSRADKDDGN